MEVCISNRILKEIRFNIEKDTRIAIIGRNASGKTTLLKCISGLLMPTDGMINYSNGNKFEFPLGFFQYLKWKKYIRKNILYIDSPEIFFEDLTIEANLLYYARMGLVDIDNTSHFLKLFNIDESKNMPICALSAGTKQKILLSFALASKKKLLCIDEPEKNLDQEAINVFYNELKKNKDKVIFFVTHQNVNNFKEITNAIYQVKDGSVNIIYEHDKG